MERNQARRRRMRQAPQRVARRFVALPSRMSPGAAIVVILVVVLMALSLATPLRNYYEQRTELAQLQSTIQEQERHKAELQAELNRFENEDYLKEQARIRLGVIEPGESAYRIISPKITGAAGEDAPGQERARRSRNTKTARGLRSCGIPWRSNLARKRRVIPAVLLLVRARGRTPAAAPRAANSQVAI